ncbi:MAG: sugar phosphate isomerase/epimerase family protein [Candidatus Bathyarchaeia archaeon]
MKIALCTIAFSEFPLENVLNLASKLSFDGVEIWGKEPHMPSDCVAYAKEVRNMAYKKGLEIVSFGSYVNPLMEQYQRRWQTALEITRVLGSKIIRIWAGSTPSVSFALDKRKAIVSRLRELAEKAQGLGITLATEMHDNTLADTAESTVKLMEDVGSTNLKTYYQPSFRPDANDFYECLERVGKYVVNVHAQNARRLPDGRMEPCSIVDGVVDYSKIVQILRTYSYDGYLEIEFVRGADKISALKRDRDFLADLLGR